MFLNDALLILLPFFAFYIVDIVYPVVIIDIVYLLYVVAVVYLVIKFLCGREESDTPFLPSIGHNEEKVQFQLKSNAS